MCWKMLVKHVSVKEYEDTLSSTQIVTYELTHSIAKLLVHICNFSLQTCQKEVHFCHVDFIALDTWKEVVVT
jgi:hypothetical protein